MTRSTRVTVKVTVGSETAEVSRVAEEGQQWETGGVGYALSRSIADETFRAALDSLTKDETKDPR